MPRQIRLTHALSCTLSLLPLFACDAEEVDVGDLPTLLDESEYELPTAEILLDETQYMRALALAQGGGEALRIDLSDDMQYDFVKHKLLLAEITPWTAPEVFSRLETARTRAVNGDEFRGTPVCGLVVLTNSDQPNGSFTHTGLSSCFNNDAAYTFMQVCQYDDFGTLLNCAANEVFGDVVAPNVVTHSVAQYALADGISMHIGSLGEEFYFYTTALLENTDVFQLNIEHPRDTDGNPGVTLWMERSPSPGNWDYRHTSNGVCGGNSMCLPGDVPAFPVFNPTAVGPAQNTYNNNRLYMPLETWDIGAPPPATPAALLPNAAVLNWAKLWMTLQTQGNNTPPGGLCQTTFTNAAASYFTYAPFGGLNKRLKINPFAVDIGDGTWSSHCVDHRANVDLHVQVEYQLGGKKRLYTWSSMGKFPFMQLAWGCLKENTPIMLPDGSEVPIEKLEVGDQVLADEDGTTLTVVEVTSGEEHEPLISIKDSFGHVLTMTSAHPVPTVERGVLEARELSVGTLIETDEGVAKVVGVERVPYDGAVYNLVLGTPEELEAHGNQTTMIANHMVVGDSRMQDALKVQRTEEAEIASAERPVPAGFMIDYVGAQLRKARRASRQSGNE